MFKFYLSFFVIYHRYSAAGNQLTFQSVEYDLDNYSQAVYNSAVYQAWRRQQPLVPPQTSQTQDQRVEYVQLKHIFRYKPFTNDDKAIEEPLQSTGRVVRTDFIGKTATDSLSDHSAIYQLHSAISFDPWNRQTVLALAKMCHNAYSELPFIAQSSGWSDWIPVDGYRRNISFGMESTGMRGYVYGSEDGKLMVIAIKGTSAEFFGVGAGPTSKQDKYQDNLMFSCCCAAVDRSWWPICPCADLSANSCNKTCLAEYINARDSYFQVAMILDLYPGVSVWFTGHSLGGALAAVAALATGRPAITFEAPGDRLFSERLGLFGKSEDQGYKSTGQNIWHYGVLGDPIFTGACKGALSTCYLAGYAIESECHTGNLCLLDMDTSSDIRNHRMSHVIQILESKNNFAPICFPELPDCADCEGWSEVKRQMYLTRTEYDRGVNTFSPEGRLFQVEYALEAIKLGSTAIGVQTADGVVLAVEKRVTSPLLEPSSIEKILEIDSHLGCAMSGLTPDSRTMIDHARVEAQNHRFVYNEPIKVESISQAVCDLALRFGEGAEGEEAIMSRPFGVALLIAGIDENGPQLFMTDPSGTLTRWEAKAIGAGSEGAQTELQEHYHKNLSLKDAENLALKVLKHVMEEKLNSTNIQVASVTVAKGFRIYSEQELQQVISSL